MVQIEDLAAQVQRNCRISDARFWGFHSICGLLLRLREQFKWEQGLEPWSKTDTAEVLPWIGEREAEWEQLQEAELEALSVGNGGVDPFDTVAVNARISPLGYFYGAGHGMAMKPLFVLGRVADRRCVEGTDVVVLGRELVRDLSPIPAMNRDGTIIARREAMKWYLWQHLEEQGTKGPEGIAARALRSEGVEMAGLVGDPAAHGDFMDRFVKDETAAAVRHEIGEILEEKRMEGRWSRTFSLSCGTKAELLSRGLKDVLADTIDGGRLDYLTGRKALVSVGLFAAFSDGLRKRLFPELGGLFGNLVEEGDWGGLEKGRKKANRRMRKFVEPLLGLFEEEMTAEERTGKTDELEEKMMG